MQNETPTTTTTTTTKYPVSSLPLRDKLRVRSSPRLSDISLVSPLYPDNEHDNELNKRTTYPTPPHISTSRSSSRDSPDTSIFNTTCLDTNQNTSTPPSRQVTPRLTHPSSSRLTDTLLTPTDSAHETDDDIPVSNMFAAMTSALRGGGGGGGGAVMQVMMEMQQLKAAPVLNPHFGMVIK